MRGGDRSGVPVCEKGVAVGAERSEGQRGAAA